MDEKHVGLISTELKVTVPQVVASVELLDGGATVPFIARYRKEATGSLDEVAIMKIRDRLEQLRELDRRRTSILDTIGKQGKLTDELKAKILEAPTLALLEDLYLPYKPKRRTRATVAIEKGLEPLAKVLFDQTNADPLVEAARYINAEKGVATVDDALAGARDIIAEWINEAPVARERMRKLYFEKGRYVSKVIEGKEQAALKYKDYFDWSEPVSKAPSHRILAMRRGAREKLLNIRIIIEEAEAIRLLEELYLKPACPATGQVKSAIEDSLKRLLGPSMETEVRVETKKHADEVAIHIFSENLRQLLLAPPLGGKNVLALDPGFRTGCKLVCLDSQGKLVFDDVAYLHQSEQLNQQEIVKIQSLCDQYQIAAIAIGNGTGGRETEELLRKTDWSRTIPIVMVNESGASIYSASPVAREEFPDKDITVRGAASIGRRLMDPLAELVKIDPKSIGVGQYQHEVDQSRLRKSLDDVVISCVNSVGVEVNTASKQLLTYVSGLGPILAENIVGYRNEHGPFQSRTDLLSVRGMGSKTFEQSAGFLRIRNGVNPLDASAVHPEAYSVIEAMCRDLNCTVTDLVNNPTLQEQIVLDRYVTPKIGLPTLQDIRMELAKPGRDPRQQFDPVTFADGIRSIEDLKPGMKLPGIVTNITAFGVFVDIGVHQDGLVHISQLSTRFVKDPAAIVKVYQKVTVWVMEVDAGRKRIGLTMKDPEAKQPAKPEQKDRKPRPQVKPKSQSSSSAPEPKQEQKQAQPVKDRTVRPNPPGKHFKGKQPLPSKAPKGEEPFGERLGLIWPSN
ncbi:MAG: S1 RNA-binding domain-containing protein [Phycisphaerae bacterium]|nr:S1 RNA-binding domain-containing protein [Phycisphaerae bacterium]